MQQEKKTNTKPNTGVRKPKKAEMGEEDNHTHS